MSDSKTAPNSIEGKKDQAVKKPADQSSAKDAFFIEEIDVVPAESMVTMRS